MEQLKGANAELLGYSGTISEGEFDTEVDGLRSGQQLIIDSTARGYRSGKIYNQ